MAQPENFHKPDQQFKQKQQQAEHQASVLRKRAESLRRFAEKYRDSSAKIILGWNDVEEKEEKNSEDL